MHLAYPAVLAALLFCTGLYGVLARRNAILVLMSVELMLNAVNLNLVAFDVWLRATPCTPARRSPSSSSPSPPPRSASAWRSSCSSTATAARSDIDRLRDPPRPAPPRRLDDGDGTDGQAAAPADDEKAEATA